MLRSNTVHPAVQQNFSTFGTSCRTVQSSPPSTLQRSSSAGTVEVEAKRVKGARAGLVAQLAPRASERPSFCLQSAPVPKLPARCHRNFRDLSAKCRRGDVGADLFDRPFEFLAHALQLLGFKGLIILTLHDLPRPGPAHPLSMWSPQRRHPPVIGWGGWVGARWGPVAEPKLPSSPDARSPSAHVLAREGTKRRGQRGARKWSGLLGRPTA